MPSPARYKNTEEGYKNFMQNCMHQTLHREKKEKAHGTAQCLNVWRQHHGPRHPGKPKKVADLIRQVAQTLSNKEVL